MSRGCINCRGETKDRFLHEVRFKISFIGLYLHCAFVEGGLSILPLIAMVVTSYKRHSIVRKTSAFWSSRSFFSAILLRLSWISMLRTFGARYFTQLLSYKISSIHCPIRLWNCPGLRPRLRFSLSAFNLFTVFQRKRTEQPVPSVNKSLKGKWASLACHETGSLVVQVQPTCRLIIKRFLIHFIACVWKPWSRSQGWNRRWAAQSRVCGI